MAVVAQAPRLTPAEKAILGRRAQLLAGASVVHNVVEAVVAINTPASVSRSPSRRSS